MNKLSLSMIFALAAIAANAADTRTWSSLIGTSYIELGPPLVSGAVASITFYDEPLHSADELFTLTDRGLDVEIDFDRQAGAGDIITIYPPEGYIAVPQTLAPGEGTKGVSHIYKYLGG